jgi:hypothetical protein
LPVNLASWAKRNTSRPEPLRRADRGGLGSIGLKTCHDKILGQTHRRVSTLPRVRRRSHRACRWRSTRHALTRARACVEGVDRAAFAGGTIYTSHQRIEDAAAAHRALTTHQGLAAEGHPNHALPSSTNPDDAFTADETRRTSTSTVGRSGRTPKKKLRRAPKYPGRSSRSRVADPREETDRGPRTWHSQRPTCEPSAASMMSIGTQQAKGLRSRGQRLQRIEYSSWKDRDKMNARAVAVRLRRRRGKAGQRQPARAPRYVCGWTRINPARSQHGAWPSYAPGGERLGLVERGRSRRRPRDRKLLPEAGVLFGVTPGGWLP